MDARARLEQYQRAFATLKVDRVPGRYPDATNGGAPHKPMLLLAVLDLLAQRQIRVNLVEFNADLLDVFDLYWHKVMGAGRDGNPVLPFYHLKSDRFWHVIPQPGKEAALLATTQIRSLRALHELVLGAQLDDELYQLLQNAADRDALRAVLIERYFAPDTRPTLVQTGTIASEAFTYSRELLDRSRGVFKLADPPLMEAVYTTDARSAGFRRVVVQAYDHTCAICKIRLLTPEGRTSVAAAHIVPWSHSHNDDPRNGVALCGLHHWAFDQGLLTVTPAYAVAISPVVPADDSRTQPLRELGGATLVRPVERHLWPAREALRWHNINIYRSDGPQQLF